MTAYQVLVVVSLLLWIVFAVVLIVGLVRAAPVLARMSESLDRFDRFYRLANERLEPISKDLSVITDNAQYISAVLREDVSRVDRTVERATEAADRIVDLTEERVTEIYGLLEVVQEEAEESFLSTASLLRALRAGKRQLTEGRSGRGRRTG